MPKISITRIKIWKKSLTLDNFLVWTGFANINLVQAVFNLTLQENSPNDLVLEQATSIKDFSKDIIISSEFRNTKEIFSNSRDMKNIVQVKKYICVWISSCWANMRKFSGSDHYWLLTFLCLCSQIICHMICSPIVNIPSWIIQSRWSNKICLKFVIILIVRSLIRKLILSSTVEVLPINMISNLW